jgi:uncharacterized protein (TIGR04255 family)
MAQEPQRSLPDFDDPPAVETLLTVRFAALEKWNVQHFGLFWNEIREEYPRVVVHPSVGPSVEFKMEFDAALSRTQVELLPLRCWFYNDNESRLIQLQNDGFTHNWRKVGGGDPYLHYDPLRQIFKKEWDRFCAFLQREGLSAPNVFHCEVTYINHLDKGKGWDTFADLPSVIPSWSGRTSGNFLPAPQMVMINGFYPIPTTEGRLQIDMHPAVREADNQQTLQLTLSSRCRPASSSTEDVFAA